MIKLPKHRTQIYVVVREDRWRYEEGISTTVIDSFRSLERAEEVAAGYEQDMKDRQVGSDSVVFKVVTSTYYDE